MGLWLHVGQLRGRSWEGVQAPKLPPESDLPGLPTGKLLESFQIVTTFQLVKGFFQLVSFQLVKIRINQSDQGRVRRGSNDKRSSRRKQLFADDAFRVNALAAHAKTASSSQNRRANWV